jgi:peptide/nickel transport system permease protein
MATRLFQAVLTLWAVSIVIFLIPRVTGNAADALLPVEATAEQREILIESLGLNRPLIVQYGTFMVDILSLDFGTSFRNKLPVRSMLGERLVNSFYLGTASLAVAIILAVPLGTIAALNRGTVMDRSIMMIPILGQSMPSFWAGILLILLFSIFLGWLPAQSHDTTDWKGYLMPSISLGWIISAGVTRLVRSSMLEVLGSEYVKLARAKGVSEWYVVFKHALRNALIPVVTFLGLTYGLILGAAISTETVFSWPGMGRLAYEAVLFRDFPLLQATTIVWATMIIGVNLIVDLMYGMLDPRIRVT